MPPAAVIRRGDPLPRAAWTWLRQRRCAGGRTRGRGFPRHDRVLWPDRSVRRDAAPLHRDCERRATPPLVRACRLSSICWRRGRWRNSPLPASSIGRIGRLTRLRSVPGGPVPRRTACVRLCWPLPGMRCRAPRSASRPASIHCSIMPVLSRPGRARRTSSRGSCPTGLGKRSRSSNLPVPG